MKYLQTETIDSAQVTWNIEKKIMPVTSTLNQAHKVSALL